MPMAGFLKGFLLALSVLLVNAVQFQRHHGVLSIQDPVVDLTGWQLVRRVKAGTTWHQSTDNGLGSQAYGTASTDPKASASFSIKYDTLDFNQFLFASGDGQKWVRASRSQVATQGGSLFPAVVLASHVNGKPYQAKWYNRGAGVAEDPWISARDHGYGGTSAGADSDDASMVYGENAYPGWTNYIKNRNGANVFVRKVIPGGDLSGLWAGTCKINQTNADISIVCPNRAVAFGAWFNSTTFYVNFPDDGHGPYTGTLVTPNQIFWGEPGNYWNRPASTYSGVDLTGWQLVRRVKTGTTWHPSTDNGLGSQAYGTAADFQADATFSIKYDTLDFNQFLFASGDGQKWVRASRNQVKTEGGSNFSAIVLASHVNAKPYQARWYNRGAGVPEDPWISARDHFSFNTNYAASTDEHSMVYGENAYPGWTYYIKNRNGANVFVRKVTPGGDLSGLWAGTCKITQTDADISIVCPNRAVAFGAWFDSTTFYVNFPDDGHGPYTGTLVNPNQIFWGEPGNYWNRPGGQTPSSGFYRLVARQTYGATPAFQAGSWSVNKDDSTAFNYAILDQLENYRLTTGPSKGSFKFKLQWPQWTPNEWIQTSNPVSSTTVSGYQAVSVTHTDHTWGGLMTGSGQALLDGSTSNEWFYAVGSFVDWNGGIPGFSSASQLVELYVWDDTGASVPDYSVGPAVWNGRYRLVAKQTVPTYFVANKWTLGAPGDANYLNLDALEKYRLQYGPNKGSFQFRLSWPGQTDQDWIQSSNPVQNQAVTGYQGVQVSHTDNNWGGLHLDGKYALLSGSSNWPSAWFYAVGSFQAWGGGIPAFTPATQVVSLYVLEDNTENQHPGFYRLVARQTYGATPAFQAGSWSVNKDDSSAYNYAILDQLENYRLTSGPAKGSFRFKLQWPQWTPNEWIQSSNPASSTTVSGYQAVSVTHTDHTWGGLMTGSGQALLDGSTSNEWFYAVGSFVAWGGGIPGFNTATQVVELYVWDDTGASAPDVTVGPKVWNGQYRLVAKQTVPTYFVANKWTLGAPGDANYLNLDALENYRLKYGANKGSFQFRLSWPGQTDQDWIQSSNPVKNQAVSGYQGVQVTHTENNWGGLHLDNKYALLSGSSNWPSAWFYAVGSFQDWNGGIPAFTPAAQVVSLYVLEDTPANQQSGFYRLVARQTWGATPAFKAGSWSVNKDDPTSSNYAILDQLENYRLTTGPAKGSFKFKLQWPQWTPNEWIQSSNPASSTTVSGYQAVSVTHTDHTWGGLMTGSGQALLDGSTSNEWFYAVGSFVLWGGGIPGFNTATQVVELYAWDDTGAGSTPDYSLGPKTDGGQYRLVARQTVPTYFTASKWTLNENDPNNFNYLKLDTLENYRLHSGANKGSFQFRLTWPGQTDQVWVQQSNPVQNQAVSGYQALQVTHTENNWGGLHLDNKYALLSGSSNWPSAWFYAVGSFQDWNGGIPAFTPASQVVALYVLDDSTTGSGTTGSVTPGGDLTGSWAKVCKVVQTGAAITITCTGRAVATGSWVDSTKFVVNFPDDAHGPYTGTLVNPNRIFWGEPGNYWDRDGVAPPAGESSGVPPPPPSGESSVVPPPPKEGGYVPPPSGYENSYVPPPSGYENSYVPPPPSGYENSYVPPPPSGYESGSVPPPPSGYTPSEGGYAPSESGSVPPPPLPPTEGGYVPPPPSGYTPSEGGYAPPPPSGYAPPPPSGYAPPPPSGYAPPPPSGYAPPPSGYAPPPPSGYAPPPPSGYAPPPPSGYTPKTTTAAPRKY